MPKSGILTKIRCLPWNTQDCLVLHCWQVYTANIYEPNLLGVSFSGKDIDMTTLTCELEPPRKNVFAQKNGQNPRPLPATKGQGPKQNNRRDDYHLLHRRLQISMTLVGMEVPEA